MSNKNYQSGRNFEYRVKKYLEKIGYYVMRSAGSKGQIDIMAVPTLSNCEGSNVLLIQCKHGPKISKKERDELLILDGDLPTGTMCVVAWSKKGGAIEFFAWIRTHMIFDADKYEWGEIKIE